MDRVDLLILSYLKDNARMKASDISKEINFSVSSVIERIKKLEKSGIIEKYTVKLNERKLGDDLVALMQISLKDQEFCDKFMDFAKNNKRILSCYYLAGEFDFMIKIRANSTESLEKVHREIKEFEGVSSVKTFFALKEVKNEISEIPDENDKKQVNK